MSDVSLSCPQHRARTLPSEFQRRAPLGVLPLTERCGRSAVRSPPRRSACRTSMEEGSTRQPQSNLVGLSVLAGTQDFLDVNAMADSKQVRNFRSIGVHSLCKAEIVAPCVPTTCKKHTRASVILEVDLGDCVVRHTTLQSLDATELPLRQLGNTILTLPFQIAERLLDKGERIFGYQEVAKAGTELLHDACMHVERKRREPSQREYEANLGDFVLLMHWDGICSSGNVSKRIPCQKILLCLCAHPGVQKRCSRRDFHREQASQGRNDFNQGPHALASRMNLVLPRGPNGQHCERSSEHNCGHGKNGLHPPGPLRLCHAKRPPVNSKKAVLGRRHSASPRLAGIVTRRERRRISPPGRTASAAP